MLPRPPIVTIYPICPGVCTHPSWLADIYPIFCVHLNVQAPKQSIEQRSKTSGLGWKKKKNGGSPERGVAFHRYCEKKEKRVRRRRRGVNSKVSHDDSEEDDLQRVGDWNTLNLYTHVRRYTCMYHKIHQPTLPPPPNLHKLQAY